MDAASRPRPWLVAPHLFLAVLALYARTASFPFVEYDDPAYVRDNPHLARGLTAESARWALTSTGYQYNWHPLTWLSHALDVELFGLEAGRHHLVNAVLHALNAALLFLALRALSRSAWPSAFAAGLFALHPLRVESVAWVAQRKDVLAGTFFALTLLAYARYARAPSRSRYALVVLALAAGLTAKPTLVTVPCLLLVLDVWPLGRTPWWRPPGEEQGTRAFRALVLEKVPLLALSAASALLTLLSQGSGGAIRTLALGERLANAAIAYVTYVRQFLLPSGLAVLYPHPALRSDAPSRLVPALGALLALALGAVLAFRARRKRPWLPAGACWFLGLLVPMIGLVQVGHQARADRYAYLPTIGLELAAAWSLAELWRARPALRAAVVALALAWLAALAALATRQLDHWRSSEALFERALAVTPGNFVAHNNLGLALARDGRIEEALAHFEGAAALRPGFHEAELNAGLAWHRLGDPERARAALQRAVAARPASGEARLCLALVLALLGEVERADAELAAALERDAALVDDPRARGLGRELQERLGGE